MIEGARECRCIHKAQTRHTYRTYGAAFLLREFYEPIHLLISIRSTRRDKTRVRQSGYSELPGIARFRQPIKAIPVLGFCVGGEGKGEGVKRRFVLFFRSQQPLFASEPLSCSISLSPHPFFSSAVAPFLPRNHCKFVSRRR